MIQEAVTLFKRLIILCLKVRIKKVLVNVFNITTFIALTISN